MYSLIEEVIIMNDNNLYHTGIYKLISSVLYISSLASISMAIPCEVTIVSCKKFDIYLIRVSNQIINTTVQNKDVIISGDVLVNDNGHLLNSIDT